MSGYSEAVNCPRCGSIESLERSVDRDDVSGVCLECGYSYKTIYENLSLEEVNEERDASELEPLPKLKEPVEGWTDKDWRG
ncbi:hypothetical protein ES703_46273 [subsurface metagenome]